MKAIRLSEKIPNAFNSNKTRRVKVFQNFTFINCCIEDVSQPSFAKTHIRKKIEKLYRNSEHVECDFNNVEKFMLESQTGIKEFKKFIKFCMKFIAYLSYLYAAGAETFFRSIKLPELLKDLVENIPSLNILRSSHITWRSLAVV